MHQRLIKPQVTYVHHYVRISHFFAILSSTFLQLPALYFSVLMVVHLIDHFVFRSRRLREQMKYGFFATYVLLIVGTFWWFKGLAYGIEGPIAEHWGLRWRKVGYLTWRDDWLSINGDHLQ